VLSIDGIQPDKGNESIYLILDVLTGSILNVQALERTVDEQLRLGHLFKVLTHLKPGLVQCDDVKGFLRTDNEMESAIGAIKLAIDALADSRTGTAICCVMVVVWPIMTAGFTSQRERAGLGAMAQAGSTPAVVPVAEAIALPSQ
jgi:hypothetical protein